MSDTIFARATAGGRAAVAVMRISGPDTGRALRAIVGGIPLPRRASLRTFAGADGGLLDRGLVLWFAGPDSYTGEDCAELHAHGGGAVLAGLSEALLVLGLRPADPGEFTRRAFENGKLDLTQAEAVADLVDAETSGQARQALGQLQGALGERYASWRGALIAALAQLEAAVDFPDEEVPADVADGARPHLQGVLSDLDLALADAARGRQIRDGYRIAVIGAPNAGKSSLVNGLAERDAAIVTAIAGTTRDIIEVPLTLAGYRVLVADMAGLRAATDAIEAEGVRRARAWAEAADLRLWVGDLAASDDGWRAAAVLVRDGDLVVLNKTDLPAGADAGPLRAAAVERGLEVVEISLLNADVGALRRRLASRVELELCGAEFPPVTRARHRIELENARTHLERALLAGEPELAAEDVRLAARALARVTGRIDAEDVLDVVFASFCIGK